jgi:tripartite-type tricarboxylate transporter receptor subunit TctC
MRTVLGALLAILALPIAAAADEFPARPLRIIVPHPAGGTVDIIARAVARGLESSLGQPVIVEPRPGANFVIGTEAVARAAPDGYTILIAPAHVVTNPLLRKLPYDGLNAFAPVALLLSSTNVIVVNPALPARSLSELIALARARRGGLNYATGSSVPLTGERFKQRAGIELNHVPYQGGVQAVLAIAGGHVEVGVVPLSDAAPHIASGKLRALAITAPERYEIVRDVPTLAEAGYPGSEGMQQWFGAFVPAGTPRAVIEKLGVAMRKAVTAPEIRASFLALALIPTPLGSEAFGEYLRAEANTFTAVIREANIKVE